MIIKDLKAFRKFYKEVVRKITDTSRNENFIGHSHQNNTDQVFGFFELFHADKSDIEKFIRTFLEMADDWQAVYELLQNAFDANSKTFALVYDKDYAIAFNDGDQFSFEGIRSILNIGQSTKTSGSNIGKFGVGFKIVHKLIGESNGLNELRNLAGPIIFSWGKNSDLQSFLNYDDSQNIVNGEVEFISQNGSFISKDIYPWLIKILITNFPCGIDDEIYDLNYKSKTNAFSSSELIELLSFAKGKLFKDHLLDINNFDSGTITFLKLGKDKYKRLDEEHVRSGISLALCILNNLNKDDHDKKLGKVYLNDLINPFQPADISIFEFLIFQENSLYQELTSDQMEYEKPERVEFYLGIPNNINDLSIKSNPNFYLYFPISDELHKYNFIIHCNVFHNLSQRTSLDDGSRNKKLLKSLSEMIIIKLEQIKETDFINYTKIYAAILTSEWSSIPNKPWVFENLMKPLSEYAKKNVPTISGRTNVKENVRIKDVALHINPSDFGVIQFDWFYWKDEGLNSEAKNSAKLNLKPALLTDLIIAASDIILINNWVEVNRENLEQIFIELNRSPIKRTETFSSGGQLFQQKTTICKRLSEIKLFLFSDQKLYSIEDIKSNEDLLLLSYEFTEIRDVLILLGFKVYFINTNNLTNIVNFLAVDFRYIADKNKFLDYLWIKLNDSKNKLSIKDIQIFITFFNSFSAPLLDKLIFDKDQEKYRILKKTEDLFQFFATDRYPILKTYISENLKDRFISLPDELFTLINNKVGLIEEVYIYKKILSEQIELLPLINVIIEADSREIQREFLDKFQVIEFIEETVYDKETVEHKMLTLARSIEYEIIREKIQIRTKENSVIPLKSIAYHNRVVFTKTLNEISLNFELTLSKILPKYSQSSALIENIIKCFRDFNEYSLRQLLGIGRGKPKAELINELDLNIENAHQLAFLLLYLNETKTVNLDVTKYKVQNRSGSFSNLRKERYFTENSIFISETNLLHEKYQEIRGLLKLGIDNPQFEVEGICIAEESFFKDGVFICFPLKNDLKNDLEAQHQIFISMYKKFSSLKERIDKISIDGTIWNKKTDKEIQYTNENKHLVFGFDPEKSVYPDYYATEEEKLPDWVKVGIEKSETSLKLQFLSVLGVNVEISELVQIRKALLGKVEIDEETIVNLVKLNRGYISRTMRWLANTKIVICENKPQIKYLRKIVEVLPFTRSTPVPIVDKISEDQAISYSIILLSPEMNFWHIDSQIKEELNSYGACTLSEIFNNLDGNLINLDFFPRQVEEKISSAKIEVSIEIDRKTIFSKCSELNEEYYLLWREEINNKFKIYKTNINNSTLPFIINFNRKNIKSIELNKKIAIDRDGNIFFSLGENELIQLLDEVVDKSGFLQQHIDSLAKKKQNTPEEIKKIFDGEFEKPPQDILDALIPSRKGYFPPGEEKIFKDKLLELLNLSKSPWSGYAFHFTHLENALAIIRSGKIQSRNKSLFRDSAGASFINTTDAYIKNFARFYFRPKTPTQYYNEGLGKTTKNDDLPQCPVPIFFKVSIKEVLDKYAEKCFVSNGNLRWYPHTKIGNSYEFLKSFDFINLYKNYAECGRWVFLTASQQEFVVKDELDLTKLNSINIICRSNNDVRTLINLIGKDHPYSNKILIDPSFYYNENPIVKVRQEEEKITASFSFRRSFESLKIISAKDINSTVIKDVVSASDHIIMNSSSKGIYSVYYVNGKSEQEWLLYENGDAIELSNSNDTNDENAKLISSIMDLDERFDKIFKSKVRHYILYDHIKNVLNEFDKYFKDWKFENILSREKMKVFLVIHDIGKPKAIESFDKDLQHSISLQLCDEIKDKFDLNESEINFFKALLSEDPIGKYFKDKLSKEHTIKLIKSIAAKYEISLKDYFELLTVYYQVDAGSYTKDAGGLPYLENLFHYVYCEKVLDKYSTRLLFSAIYERRYEELFNEIGL